MIQVFIKIILEIKKSISISLDNIKRLLYHILSQFYHKFIIIYYKTHTTLVSAKRDTSTDATCYEL